ncbi:TPA: hypothetical protein NJT28_000961 [Corynebacterium striatum]|uniref:hypothetical protein n=1 Tax=Corynebacterium striatum TaxID=43770 RepID=UPI001428B583|nr:hypothetical protein [Corynebacterium striatum]HCG2962315.1 hypothetical protein [Corynebacterium striatum]
MDNFPPILLATGKEGRKRVCTKGQFWLRAESKLAGKILENASLSGGYPKVSELLKKVMLAV